MTHDFSPYKLILRSPSGEQMVHSSASTIANAIKHLQNPDKADFGINIRIPHKSDNDTLDNVEDTFSKYPYVGDIEVEKSGEKGFSIRFHRPGAFYATNPIHTMDPAEAIEIAMRMAVDSDRIFYKD
jgi:hypothetical protein